MDEELEEAAYFDMLSAREAALIAATGAFAVDNVPSERLHVIVERCSNEIITLAAKVVLYQRDRNRKS